MHHYNNENIGEQWLTHFEKSDFTATPSYAETVEYFRMLADKSPYAKILNFGVSHQNRNLICLVVSETKEFTPKRTRKSPKSIVLINNGLHPGEIDGKDASMMLLRDILITQEKEYLLENITFLVVPVLNADGHERMSHFNRVNQNGPIQQGWRTNALNLNLNRDFMKADSAEIKSFLRLYAAWAPDLLIDTHVTNGMDYQYHLTYGMEKHQNLERRLSIWGNEVFLPNVIDAVEREGYVTAPYIETVADKIEDGIKTWSYEPRYSTGYAALQNRLALLVESHSLKPYKERVFATKTIILESLEFINNNHKELKDLSRFADRRTIQKFFIEKKRYPILLAGNEESEPFTFKGYKTEERESEITGGTIVSYTDEKVDIEIQHFNKMEIAKTVKVPDAYLIPAEHKWLPRILKLHGIIFKHLDKGLELEVEKYKFSNVKFAETCYEGKFRASFDVTPFIETVTVPPGTFFVPVNQRTLRVVLNLLEPLAPDSIASWGYFNALFEKKEYIEDFVFEPIAAKMMEEDPRLREDFYFNLEEDEEFRNDPAARLDFFYRKSPYYENNEMIYPVMKVYDGKRYFNYFDRFK
ncbi:M14 family metallopeptidase [Ignavibacteriales bacterium]